MLWEYLGSWSSTTRALYKLNGNANDSSWNWNNGTATNITWVWWISWNGAASFNGSSSYITLPSTAINNITSWTISVWVKRNTIGTQHSFIDKLQVWVSNQIQFMYEGIWWVWDNKVRFRINDQTLASADVITDTTNWINWVWTRENGVGIKLYKNWILNSSNATSTSLPNNGATIYIWHVDTTWVYMNWLMDEVIAESRVWTANDVSKYYTATKWRFVL